MLYARLDLWLQLQHEAAELRCAADAGAREIAALQRERELLQVSLRCAPLPCHAGGSAGPAPSSSGRHPWPVRLLLYVSGATRAPLWRRSLR